MSRLAAVTGGTGFVGRFLLERLLADGWRVRVLGRNKPFTGYFSQAVEFAPWQLDPSTRMHEALDGASLLVHAAFDHVPGRYRGGEGDDPAGFRRRNLDGTVALFESAKAASVARAVFLSSRAVYGTQPQGTVLDEDTPCRPDTLYGEVKLATEQALAELAAPGFRIAILRATGVYGPSSPGTANKWDALLADWRDGRAIKRRQGTEVHGDDLGSAMKIALDALSAREPCLIFNVSDLLVDHADIVSALNRAAGLHHPVPPRSDAAAFNPMSTERLHSLGWRPGGRTLLESTLADMARMGGGHGDGR